MLQAARGARRAEPAGGWNAASSRAAFDRQVSVPGTKSATDKATDFPRIYSCSFVFIYVSNLA
jgi:hypothetical protein